MIAPHHSGLERQIDSIPVEARKMIIERLRRECRLDLGFDHHDTGDFLKGVAWLPGFSPQFLEVMMNDTIAAMRRTDDDDAKERSNSSIPSVQRTAGSYVSPYFQNQPSGAYTAH